ncbi:MAG: hypothetical protein KAU95_01010, partial [Candidatus Aenigmarchaeota archaeon]|nr:hypothetical protein [Candidatus Aenigmarchaeota archaeon]
MSKEIGGNYTDWYKLLLSHIGGVRIEVATKDTIDLGGKGIVTKQPIRVFQIKDDTLTPEEIKTIESIVADPVCDIVSSFTPVLSKIGKYPDKNAIAIEQSPKPRVTDPDGEETRKAIQRTLGREIGPVSFSEQYVDIGKPLKPGEFVLLTKQLGNPLINDFYRAD